MALPLSIGWFGPVGAIWLLAFASSQFIAPQRPNRSGVMIQTVI